MTARKPRFTYSKAKSPGARRTTTCAIPGKASRAVRRVASLCSARWRASRRWLISVTLPSQAPWASPAACASTQRSDPSARCTRNSERKSDPPRAAAAHSPVTRARSSSWMPRLQGPCTRSPGERPASSQSRSLTHRHSPLASARKRPTGAAPARVARSALRSIAGRAGLMACTVRGRRGAGIREIPEGVPGSTGGSQRNERTGENSPRRIGG